MKPIQARKLAGFSFIALHKYELMPTSKKPPANFEKAMDELESLIASMESNTLPLDKSLQHFERGIQLTRHCQRLLNEAEQRVNMLMKEDTDAELDVFKKEDN